MGIRVKVEIRSGERSVATSALVNAGYEAEEAEICLPKALAERLGLSERGQRKYLRVGGEVVVSDLGHVEVRIVPGGKWVRARAICVEGEREVLLSDRLIDALEIVPISFGEGLWRLKGEEATRRSEPPQLWY